MNYVLTLTADPAGTPIEDSIVATLRAALGGASGEPDWLAPGIACDLSLRAAADLERARAVLAGHPIDVNVIPLVGRRKRLLVADMESTLIRNEMLDDLAAAIGIGDAVADITRRAMNGELDFREALRERVALLAGLPAERLEDAAHGIEIMPGARTLVATMRAHGAYTAIVSGGFRLFTSRVRATLGADFDEGNDLEIAAGALTGEVREPVLNRDGKLEALRRLAAERALPLDAVLSVGDGANDVPMLKAAGLGVAFRAKPRVAAEVACRIDHGDLTALLYLQGYRQSELIAA